MDYGFSNGNDQRLFIRGGGGGGGGVKLIFDKNINIGDKNSGQRIRSPMNTPVTGRTQWPAERSGITSG